LSAANFSSSSGLNRHVLPLFGQNLFDSPSPFAPLDNVPVTPDYVMGRDDPDPRLGQITSTTAPRSLQLA
jgi:hypothetical protein